MAQVYWGDFLSGDTIELHYFSFNSLGASATPSSAGSVIVYKTGSAVQTSVGIVTHTLGYDSIVGFNRVVINSLASTAFYTPGADYTVIASGSSVDGQFVNIPVGTLSIQNRYAPGLIHRGIAAGAGNGTLTLDANSRSATTSLYIGATAFPTGVPSFSTGAGQARNGTAYDGATGVLTTGRNWTTNPASGTSYELYAGELASTVAELQSGLTSGTADAILGRSLAGSADTDVRSVRNALRALRNRVAIGGSTITIFEEDDTTSAWTGSVTTAGSAIQTINPFGP